MTHFLTERLAFLDISDQTRRDLREAKPYIDAIMPSVLDGFYAHVSKFPIAKMFSTPASMQHAKAMQLKHWELITSGDFTDSYVESVRRIGEAHNTLGLEPRWYIGGYSYIVNMIVSNISSHLCNNRRHDQTDKRNAWLSAVTKAVMLDMDFAISVYLDAGRRDKQTLVRELASDFDDSVRGVIDEVARSAVSMQDSARTLADVAKESREKTILVAAAAVETSHTSSTVAAASEELSASITEISKQVQLSAQVTQEATEMASAVTESMQALLEQTNSINQVTEFIDNVASQINLLALNATIESARAGEAGRGFTVVASEVKNLAGQTAKAAGDISQQVRDILKASSQAETQIQRIVSIINQISSNTASIAAAIEEQSAATGEIAKNVTETSAAADDVSRNITIVEQGTEQTNTSSEDVLRSAEKLDMQTTLLREKVDAFLMRVQSA